MRGEAGRQGCGRSSVDSAGLGAIKAPRRPSSRNRFPAAVGPIERVLGAADSPGSGYGNWDRHTD